MSDTLIGIELSSMDVTKLSEEELVAYHEFVELGRQESRPEDPPAPLESLRAELANIPDFAVLRSIWALDDGRLVGSADIQWLNTDENKHLIYGGIRVLPGHRRRGIATALLAKVADLADAEGRTLLVGATSERVPAGAEFARRVGAEGAMAMHINRLDLAELDRDLVRRWIDEGPARAPGYSLVTVDGPYPDDLIEEIADVFEVMNDAPRDDLQMEDQKLTVEQVRDIDKMLTAQKAERWALFARHEETGKLVGLTYVVWRPDQPETVGQGDTGVRPEHRGHALGKWLKAAMLQRILDERPQAKDVRTGNADSNGAMLGINRALGFKPYIATMNWQVPVEKVRAYLSR
jgi:GNAT superfamily N-acetyltransferase